MAFVPIQNRERAKQLVSFDGMELGEKIWPTDFDAVIDWKDRAWILFEVKHDGKDVPFGQRLALERFVQDARKAGKYAVAVVVEHFVDDTDEDVKLAACNVREVYWSLQLKWRGPNHDLTARELTDRYLEFVN